MLWFRYDALNRRTQKDFTTQKSPGAGDVVYTYDGGTYNRNGRLQQVVDASGTVVFRYDALGRITQTDKTLDGTTYTTQSTYDGLGRLLTVTYPGTPTTVISYAYNGPLLDKVFDSTTTYIQYSQYNALGQAGLTRYGNGVTTTKTYAQTTNTVCSQQNFRLCTLKTAGPAGVLTASAAAPGTSVNLSTEGTTDWAHWGLTNASSFNHKSGVTAQISTFSAVGGGTAQRFDDNPTSYTWTGGTPTASATNSPTGVYIVGLNKGFQLTVPADTTPRTVKLYLGGWGAQAKFEATLSDQSAAGYTDTSFNDSGSGDGTNRVYTLTYQAASPNQTLTLTWTVTGMNDPQWGNVSLQGATLVTGSVSGALAGSLATPSATVTLSTEGTTDWAHWGLTTASSFNHKSGITAQISNYSALGGGTAARYDTNPNGYSWTDGTPTASATNSPTGLYINGLNKGFQITVPADTTSRTVKVYVGVWGARGKLEATLSDSSASAYVDTSVTDPGGSSDGIARVYTLTYRAASAGQTLTVKWTVETMHEALWGNVTLQAATLVTNSNSGTVYQDLQYAYTADGNLTTIADHTVAGGVGDQSMTYDSLDRLTEAEGPYGTGGATASITYSYNEIGNLTANSQVGSYTYPTSGSNSTRPHAVSTAGSNSYTYDANGNMTAGAGRSFTYNLENKPLTITIGGQTTAFVYDGDNGRVKKVVGSTTTRYIGKLYECENSNCSQMIFAGSERVATLVPSGGVHYYHPDHLGSSSVITDGTGAKVQNLTYFPYGATRTNSSPVTLTVNVPYKYTGKELDSSTDLYYYGARYYDPVLARFITADTLVMNPKEPQDLNRYAYAANNPFIYTDPTGHFSIKIGKFINRALDNNSIRVVGWVFAPGVMLLIDPATRGVALPIAASVVGAAACGPLAPVCAGAAAGATNAAIRQSEGKRANILRAALGGAAAPIAAGLTSSIPYCGALCSFAAAGATNAAINKQDPGKGAIQGLISGAIAAPFIAAGAYYSTHTSAETPSKVGEASTDPSSLSIDQSDEGVLVAGGPKGNSPPRITRDQSYVGDAIGEMPSNLSDYYDVLSDVSKAASNARIQQHFLGNGLGDHHLSEIYGGQHGVKVYDLNGNLVDIWPGSSHIFDPKGKHLEPFTIPPP